MFKRVGATIVTIVMLLSMVSVFSSALSVPMGLTVELVDGEGNPLSSVMPGEALEAIVKVENPTSLSGMTVIGEYDTDLFESNGEIVVESYEIGGIDFHGLTAENNSVEVAAAWVAEDNVMLADGALLLTVPLKAKAEAALGEATISFRFYADGMKIKDAGGAVALDGAKYSDEPEDTTIFIGEEATTRLEVEAPANAEVGDTIEVVVNVKGYENNWATLSIIGSYNSDVLELVEDSVVFGTFKNSALMDGPIFQAENGKIAVVWVNENLVSKDAEFEALRLSFLVKDAGDANLSFSFKEDGIFGENNGQVTEGFDVDPVNKEIDIAIPPEGVGLKIETPTGVVKVGDVINIKVNVRDYEDAWAVMTIKGTYDATKLQLMDIVSEEFSDTVSNTEAVEEYSEGQLAVTWINKEAVVKGAEFEALTLTFLVLAEGDADLSFEFVPDGIKGANGADVSTDDYVTEAEQETISIESGEAKTHLDVRADKDSAREDEIVTVEVKVNNYESNWAVMTITGAYDPTEFKLLNYEFGDFTDGGLTQEPVFVDENGVMGITWINDNVVTKAASFTAMTLTFEVLNQGDGTGEFNFAFVPEGILDADGALITEGFSTDEAKDEVDLIPADGQTELSVSVDADSVEAGQTVTYTVSVKEYRDNWQTMTILANYDPAKLRFREAINKVTGFSGFEAEESQADPGTVGIAWFNTAPVVLGQEFEAVELVFEVVGTGEAEVSFKFEPEGLIVNKDPATGVVTYAPAGSFSEEPVSESVTLQASSMRTELEVSANSDLFEVGRDVTYTVGVQDYQNKWLAMTIVAEYDPEELSFNKDQTVSKITGDSAFKAFEFIDDPVAGTIKLVWLNDSPVALGESFEAVDLVFTTLKEGKAEVSFKFEKNGIIIEDPFTGEETYAPEISYDSNAVSKEIEVVAEIIRPSLEVVSEALAVLVNEKNSVALNLKDFNSRAQAISVRLYYEKDKVTITEEDVEALQIDGVDGVAYLNAEEGYIQINWEKATAMVGAENVALANISYIPTELGQVSFYATIEQWIEYDGVVKVPDLDYIKQSPTLDVAVELSFCDHIWNDTPVHKEGTTKHIYTCIIPDCGLTKEEDCSQQTRVVDPTCMDDGYTVYDCTVCGNSYVADIIQAPGEHGALILHYIAPTTTANGSIITQCDSCKEFVVPPYAGAVKKTLKAGHPFPDVQDPKSWYYDAVNFNKAFGVFGGDTAGNFNPTANITRGQLVTVLGRIIMAEAEKTMSDAEFNAFLNEQTSKVSGMDSTTGFTDLSGKYYERYAKLFAKWGIINGYPDGTFGGDKNITRQEMATLIKRFVEAYCGSTDNISFGTAASFKDSANVSGWAKDNVKWVGEVGLFQGDANKNYNPMSNATRGEIAVVIYRMLPVLEGICVCTLNH